MNNEKGNIPIIITGMHRSGTSMITSYLDQLRLNVGDSLMNPDEHNPKGSFEDLEFLALQRKMLSSACNPSDDGHHDWGFTTGEALNTSVYKNYIDEAKELIKSRVDLNTTWGWKDPRTSLLLDFWSELIPDAYYILIFRNPWEVMRSMRNLNAEVFQTHPEYAFKIWKQYNEALLAFYRKNKDKCLLVSANRFLQKPEELAKLLTKKFGLTVSEKHSKDYSFYSDDLFYKELAREELKAFRAQDEIFDLLCTLHCEADLTGYLANDFVDARIKKIRASVVIPCYNQGEFLLEAVSSVERSLIDNYEIIIVNDGSSDWHTKLVLKQLEDEGYSVIHQINKGLASARNVGIEVAIGEFILPLDADNRIDPEYIIEAIRILDSDPSIAVVYGNQRLFGQQFGYRTMGEFNAIKLLVHNFIDACAMIRNSALKLCNGYDIKIPVAGYEDWELWVHIHSNGWKFHYLDLYIYDYRVRFNSMLSKTSIPSNRSNNAEYIANKHHNLYEKHAVEIFKYYTLHSAELELIVADRDRLNLEFDEFRAMYIKSQIKSPLRERFDNSTDRIRKIKSKIFKRKLSLYNLGKLVGTKEGNRKIKRKLKQGVFSVLKKSSAFDFLDDAYENWKIHHFPSSSELQEMHRMSEVFSYRPLISIITPTYNSNKQFLQKAYDSIKKQVYSNWEWCVADDCSTDEDVRKQIKEFANSDKRIHYTFRKNNGHISLCSNDAIGISKGDFLILLDHDDELAPETLFSIVELLQTNPEADFIYSDEDKIDSRGRFCEPHFKPDYCPDNLLARNYITHMACIRRSIIKDIGGFRGGFEGSQDYDLFLRVVEQTKNIFHIPKVLYHWRMHSASVAKKEDAKEYAFDAGVKAVNEALVRRKEKGKATIMEGLPGYYSVRYKLEGRPKISIIIPSKDQTRVLKTCIDSIIQLSTYDQYEIIVINNNSSDPSFFNLMNDYRNLLKDNFNCIDVPIPFNYSSLINIGVEAASGEYLLLLNNDTEVITSDWMEAMLEQAQRQKIGAVGVKLLYPDKTIQHAGVVIGLGGVAGHTFIGKERDEPGYYYYIQAINNYSSVTAACLLIHKNKFIEVSGFDDKLAVEYNDVDFCLKICEAGYNNIYLPHVELFHHESLTRGHPHKSKESYERHILEIGIFKDRWNKYIQKDPCYSPNLSLDVTDFQIRN